MNKYTKLTKVSKALRLDANPGPDDEGSSSSSDSGRDSGSSEESNHTGYDSHYLRKKSRKGGLIDVLARGITQQPFESQFVGDPRYPDTPFFYGDNDVDNYVSWTLALQSKLRCS